MKGFNKIATSVWIQGCLGIGIGKDYIKPFLEAIYCTGFAIYYKLGDKEN